MASWPSCLTHELLPHFLLAHRYSVPENRCGACGPSTATFNIPLLLWGHYHIPFQYILLFIKAYQSTALSLPPEQNGVVHTSWRTLLCSALLFCNLVSGTVYLTWFNFYFRIVQIFFSSFLPFYTCSLVWSWELLLKKNAHFISVGYKTEEKNVRKVCFLF